MQLQLFIVQGTKSESLKRLNDAKKKKEERKQSSYVGRRKVDIPDESKQKI